MLVDWVRQYAPSDEDAALAHLAAIRDGLVGAWEKPGRYLDGLKGRAKSMPAAQLPWFWDMAGHRMSGMIPRHAATAYGLARQAEKKHGLPVDAAYDRENALLFARLGALPATAVNGHQKQLRDTLEPPAAHDAFVRFLGEFTAGGGTPARDLHGRVRSSAKAAGLGKEEVSRVLGEVLAAAKGRELPEALLEGAEKVFAQVPPQEPVRQALAELFPTSVTDGGVWLRLLRTTGVDTCMAEGRIVPGGGLSQWLGSFAFHYSYKRYSSGVMQQAMPEELFSLVPRLAPLLRAEGTPVRLHRSRFRHTHFDADLVDVCLAHGIAVEDPGPRVGLGFAARAQRRDLRAIAADPVLGARLEGTKYAPPARRSQGRLPLGEETDVVLHGRVTRLLDTVAEGGLGAAQEAVETLDTLLDPPAITVLEGIEEALVGLDGAGPLLRTLRAGLPDELGWPALAGAVERLTSLDPEAASGAGACTDPRAEAVVGVTCTWPSLTVFTRNRAVVVDPVMAYATTSFVLPEGCVRHAVFYIGGSFLVGFTHRKQSSTADKAFWTDRPDEIFVPQEQLGMVSYGGSTDGGLGFQFATPDNTGRYDGERITEPGSHAGIGGFEQQLGDGERLWSSRIFGSRRDSGSWREIDPATGARTESTELPPFLAAEPPQGLFRTHDLLTHAAMPPGAPESPLGQADGAVGCRVLHREHSGNAPVSYVLESVDGRRAEFRVSRPGERPWGVVRMPGGGAEAVLTSSLPMRCYAAEDNSLLWEARGFPSAKYYGSDRMIRSTTDAGPMFPPPAFWHFLRPWDEGSSRALRTTGEDAVLALLDAARDVDDAAVLARARRVLPEVTHPRVLDGVVRAVRAAARVAARRRTVSARAALIGAGARVRPEAETDDTVLSTALSGLVRTTMRHNAPKPLAGPATVTALAADGAFLRGSIGDEVRRVSPPGRPLDWSALLGRIDAIAWRCVVDFTPAQDRTALTALLRTWAWTPFAEPGTAWRLGQASGTALGPLCAAGQAVAAGLRDGREGLAPDPAKPMAGDADYRFVQPVSAPVPEGAVDVRTVEVVRDDATRIRRLLELAAVQKPLVSTAPKAVAAFGGATGVDPAVAALALAGLPKRADYREQRRMMRSKPFRATAPVIQQAEYVLHRTLGVEGRLRVLAAALPDDPAELWTDAGPVLAAERMAAVWTTITTEGPATS